MPYGVAEVAGAALRPCVVLAGQVTWARGRCALGVESAYSLVEAVGRQRVRRPGRGPRDLAERVARTWSRE